MKKVLLFAVAALLGLASSLVPAASVRGADEVKLLNVSYDPTRELYEALNPLFIEQYKKDTGTTVKIEQSHGGSSKQARGVIDGLQADVVTLALGWDITAIQKAGLIKEGWQERLPNNAAPYTSTVVFLVRKGNPKQIKEWNDLVKEGVQVIVANPKTSGGARWAFLAAWGVAAGAPTYDLSDPKGVAASLANAAAAKEFPVLDNAKAKAYITQLYQHVPVLDTGARGSTVSFAQKLQGDVLVTWENEAWLAQEEFGKDKFEIVYPSVSILAEPPVAVVDKVVDARGSRAVAEAYLKFLYTPEAQDVIGALHYRPRNAEVLKKYASTLPPIKLFTIQESFGGWAKAQKTFFADGGVFDAIYAPKK
ncbi:MAG: sulfate ABC transporter substrate-binding protein [Phycisphaerae bacterium]